MRVFQIVAGVAETSGGPSYTVPSLCTHLSDLGVNVELNILKDSDRKDDFIFSTVEHHKNRFFPARLGVSSEMKRYLLANVETEDVIHAHGLWMMPNIYPGVIAKKVGAKMVLSPRGMLAKWSLSRSKVLKKIVGRFGQYKVILNADCIHVTAESEYEDVRAFGYKGPITVIPNGVDLFDKGTITKPNKEGKRKIIFISRLHPKKGIELLLEAWKKIYKSHPEWELEICGPGDLSYVATIKQSIDSMPGAGVRYVAPVYKEEKSDFFNKASLFILPTYSENFGVVVAEALSYNVPVIVSKGAPWGGVVKNNCGWWIENTVEEIISVLNIALRLPQEELLSMGENGREWMEKEFSWDTISENMLRTYSWLNNKIDKPSFIHIE